VQGPEFKPQYQQNQIKSKFKISATQVAETGGLRFESSLDKRLARPYLKNKPGVVVYTRYLGGGGRKTSVQGQPEES
jgi:hypothetical protein